MAENTYISDVMDTVQLKRACDEACKKVLASKEIASRILKAVVPEYKNCTVKEIMQYISDIGITPEPVDPDTAAPAMTLGNSEDTTLLEGKRLYDIKFTAKAPGKDRDIMLIINIEAQKNFDPGYSLVKRGMYYCCRLVSSQYGPVFSGSDYDRLQKVYSIWICTDPDKRHRNTIIQYNITPYELFGRLPDKDKDDRDYDLLSLIMVCLNSDNNSENDIIRMLTTLFDHKVRLTEKKAILQNEYGIEMTKQLNSEVDHMCNISERYFEDGMEKGEKKGMEKQLAQIINMMLSDSKSYDEIAKALHMSPNEVKRIAKSSSAFA